MIAFLAGLYRRLVIYSAFFAPLALLLLRLGWGWELIESGYGHLTHLPDTVSYFNSLHIPYPKINAIVSGSTEFVGGVLLMLGLGARAICIPLFFNFCVAFATASHDNVVHIFSQDASKIVDDTAYPFLITSLVILTIGPGLFSLDAILQRTIFKRYSAGLK